MITRSMVALLSALAGFLTGAVLAYHSGWDNGRVAMRDEQRAAMRRDLR